MATSDRTYYKQVLAGALGASRDVASAATAVAQDAQRFATVSFGPSAVAAGTDVTLPMIRLDRAVVIKEVRLLPGGTAAASGTNYVTVSLSVGNDAGGALVSACSVNTSATGWSLGTSVLVGAPGTAVAAGSQLEIVTTHAGTGVAVPANTVVQVIWEEV